jgi:RHS repeat-associated protein
METRAPAATPRGGKTRGQTYRSPPYDGAHHVLSRTDAKQQVTGYTYDLYGRLTAVAHYPTGVANGADPNQQVSYYYDTNPYNDPISNNTWGRLAAVAFGNACTASMGSVGYVYMYGYNPAGRVTGQKMRVAVNDPVPGNQSCAPYTPPDQTANYGWDTEGRMTSLTYPGGTFTVTSSYSAMGQLTGMTDPAGDFSVSATYGTAGEMDSLSGQLCFGGNACNNLTQSFTYNNLWQLTGDGTTQYVYTAGQNNGRISQSISGGQTVNYTYDSLNRLSTAQATDGTWGNAYSYDGFGNLTAKTVTAGSAPNFGGSYDLATNHGGGAYGSTYYDANGNPSYGPLDPATGNWVNYTYDVENRIIGSYELNTCYALYGYDPQGKRILVQTSGLGNPTSNGTPNAVTSYAFAFYGITGQRLSTFSVVASQYANSGNCNGARYCTGGPYAGYLYFGGRLIAEPNSGVLTDRLGSQRNGMSYYPWGEEKTSTPDGQAKFATYFRDMPGQDYADQRYFTATTGRFYTPDPAGRKAANATNPTSWNMYIYANDDPVNVNDPIGLIVQCDSQGNCVDTGTVTTSVTVTGDEGDPLAEIYGGQPGVSGGEMITSSYTINTPSCGILTFQVNASVDIPAACWNTPSSAPTPPSTPTGSSSGQSITGNSNPSPTRKPPVKAHAFLLLPLACWRSADRNGPVIRWWVEAPAHFRCPIRTSVPAGAASAASQEKIPRTASRL